MEINVCPEWLLAKLKVPAGARIHVALLLSSLLALTISPVLTRIPHFCLMQRVLGIPCPGCGILHSLIAVLQLHFAAAWQSNPAGIALALFLVLQICGRTLALAFKMNLQLLARFSQAGQGVVIALLFSVWFARLLNV